MALTGINKKRLAAYGGSARCYMADETVAAEAKERGITRASVSMEHAARDAKESGRKTIFVIGNAPTALIAADEEAVWAFMDGKLSFTGIAEAVRRSMERISVRPIRHFEEVFDAEREARVIAREEIKRIATKG
jgi:hypothetical protein